MKKYMQNLFVPFAVLAMLTIGAFNVNASNNKDVLVEVNNLNVQTPYEGDLYYWDNDSHEFKSTEREAPLNTCTLSDSGIAYEETVIGIGLTRMYGIDPLTNEPGAPLFVITQE
ncbi:hypothetical protein HX052_17160 [Myroides marinus]|uniref:hypothetical protein n=1 Tax=Myroides marinus TaxID=703342 RepID=UPI002574E872|nr:hypothetical protein [Myroides marinus]MDM1352134.1 hypothetical protein [Myroides marinus]MDM1359325.1 hypothetical protein [Myroides marinus]MDM1363276.1 hypothetical protein [Myroides marinus]MDM1370300.1 hypothetical protein [Myroides marinus]MDM1373706.1 hypothetical protein [Myroides marinus]